MAPRIRINKLLSLLGVLSRRKADEMINEGLISVNGRRLTRPGAIIDTDSDRITIKGKEIDIGRPGRRLYYLVNKPKGYISTAKDTHSRKTVLDITPKGKGLFPVGRLDKDTTGLIIVTNDGRLAHRLMHPRYEIDKVYEVEVRGMFKNIHIAALKKGINIGDKRPSVCEAIKMRRLKTSSKITLSIHEGRKRQIRRTFAALGYSILALERIRYGALGLDVSRGSHRPLSDKEVAALKKGVGLT